MMSKPLLAACMAALLIVSCAPSTSTATIDDLVGEIVKHAKAGDNGFFAQYMDLSSKGQEGKLTEMIKSSDMADNYKNRLEDITDTKARLNYHYLERGCHFQINLEKHNELWTIKRIWFCR